MSRSIPRKDLQLCAQVQEALYWALGASVGDEALALLEVLAVEPMPHARRLLVTVSVPAGLSLETSTGRLHAASKAIRAEVAASIHRRKAPELVFRVIPGH